MDWVPLLSTADAQGGQGCVHSSSCVQLPVRTHIPLARSSLCRPINSGRCPSSLWQLTCSVVLRPGLGARWLQLTLARWSCDPGLSMSGVSMSHQQHGHGAPGGTHSWWLWVETAVKTRGLSGTGAQSSLACTHSVRSGYTDKEAWCGRSLW